MSATRSVNIPGSGNGPDTTTTLFPPQRALHYGDWLAEYEALRMGAGLVDFGGVTQIELTGDDAPAFLNRMCTNQIDRLAPGEGRESFLTDAKGHVVGHLRIFCGRQSLVLQTAAGQAQRIMHHLERYLVRDKVKLHDRTGEWSEWLLAGPKSRTLLTPITQPGPPSEPLGHLEAVVAGLPVRLRRIDFGDVRGYLISLDRDAAGALWRAFQEGGARPCGSMAWEAIRIEAGWPCYGVDITEENLPQEVGRDRQAISFDKGCYLGQEVVARLQSRGHVNRRLAGLRFESAAVPPPGTPLSVGWVSDPTPLTIGRVTSAAFSPGLHAAIALAYVRREFIEPGTVLASPLGPAEVVALPMRAEG